MTETKEMTSQDQTKRVAASYKSTIEALDTLEDALRELADRDIDIRYASRRQVAAACRMVSDDPERQSAALDLFDDMDMNEVSESSLVGVWLDQQLEIVLKGSKSLGSSDGWTTDACEVLIAYGGPSVRLTVYPDQAYGVVRVDWWTEHATEMVYCPTISDYLNDYLSELDFE
jgi:hypothetical protein